jgi:hypothetical protein
MDKELEEFRWNTYDSFTEELKDPEIVELLQKAIDKRYWSLDFCGRETYFFEYVQLWGEYDAYNDDSRFYHIFKIDGTLMSIEEDGGSGKILPQTLFRVEPVQPEIEYKLVRRK